MYSRILTYLATVLSVLTFLVLSTTATDLDYSLHTHGDHVDIVIALYIPRYNNMAFVFRIIMLLVARDRWNVLSMEDTHITYEKE